MNIAKKLLCLSVLLGGFSSLTVHGQQQQRLNEGWEFLRGDLGGVWEGIRPVPAGGPESVPIWKNVVLPHSYNSHDAVNPFVNFYQGPAWYRTNLTIDNPYKEGRTLLHFEGSGQKSKVYVYDQLVAEHVGGYDEWTVDITDAVARFKQDSTSARFKGKVPVLVRTDNSRDLEMIPSDMSDFNVYGGLYRYVNLKYTPKLSANYLFAEAKLSDNLKNGTVNLRSTWHNPLHVKNASYQAQIKDQSGKVIAQKTGQIGLQDLPEGQSLGELKVSKPELWSVDKPYLYTVELAVINGTDTAKTVEKIGFRNFEFVQSGPFKLNGERLLLRGTHRHEDHAGVGPAMTQEQIIKEMSMMKEMGVNFIRLGHYQQSPIVLEACDSLGILVWEEIPWCRGGLGGPIYKKQAKEMLTNMIHQHYNHPSIIIWGMGNENDWPGDFPEFDKQKIRDFMTELHNLSHQLDDSRKTAIRRCDFCKDIVDVYSPSIWAGWYRGVYTDYKTASHNEFQKVNHFLHVEWGGDSHAGRHSELPDDGLSKVVSSPSADERAGDASLFGGPARVSKDGDWSESYIVNLIDWHLKEQEDMPWLTGTAYWPFKDFSTPLRPENPVPYVNQKGVIERDFKKKEAFYVFQSYWTDKPMVRIYGHNWPVRWGDLGQKRMVKVYSNAQQVELFLNGKSQGKRKRDSQDFPAAGLRWMVEFNEGENQLIAVANKDGQIVRDTIVQEYQTKKWEKPHHVALQVIEEKNDTILVQAQLYDINGVPTLDAKDYINFQSAGDGELLADLGTSDGSSRVQAYNGRAQIRLVRTGDNLVVSAHADSLNTAILDLSKVKLQVKATVESRVKSNVISKADSLVSVEALTVTSAVSPRSAGSIHDFNSEGDYWWPNPKDPDGPYIRRDGLTNPDNFVAHRNLLMRFGDIMGTLVSAWKISGDKKYVQASINQAKAWFIDEKTKMNPSMEFSQAIKGVATGRGIGIIDGVHLVEVARSLYLLDQAGQLPQNISEGTKKWFSAYLNWIMTHPYGIAERDTKNNHAACWALQVAGFAQYVGDKNALAYIEDRYKKVLLPNQMADNGSFPLELERTKPYGYSLFNLDVFTSICNILQEENPSIANIKLGTKSIKQGIEFMYPFVKDKNSWPFMQDVMYYDNWPIAHPFLIFGAKLFNQQKYIDLWSTLPIDYSVEEIRRNSPLRYPLLWL